MAMAGDHVSEPMNEEELRYYQYASNVNVSNFVSVSVLTESNYDIWKEQMLCLLDSQNLRGFIDATVDHHRPTIKSPNIITQYERLVKGWILRFLNEDTHRKLSRCCNPQSLWEELQRLYHPKQDSTNDNNFTRDLKKRVQEVLFPEQVKVTTTLTYNTSRKDKLVKAIVDGRWSKAKIMLKNNKDAATEELIGYGFSMVHVAVIKGSNNFLESLLDFIDDDENKIKATGNNYGGKTPLHCAAIFNNKRAAQLLVKKCKSLLFCGDNLNRIPLEIAYDFKTLDTFLYLWEAINEEQAKPEDINRTQELIRETISFDILEDAIFTKRYDLATKLVNTFPQVAMQDDRLLMAMARTFPSDLSYLEAFIRPSLPNFHQRILKRSSSPCKAPVVLYAWAEDVLWAKRSVKGAMWLLHQTVLILLVPADVLYQLICLLILVIRYPFDMLYFLLWKVFAIPGMTSMRRIEEKRKKYQEAKEFVKIICSHIDKLGAFSIIDHPCYNKPFLEAVRQGAYEIVDEILYRLPDLARYYPTQKSHIFFELAITNRSEKIYNLIYHFNDRMDRYRELEDSFQNNILHLAGRLAPEHILSRTRGAALQLQRELQWFQEVEKLMSPGDLLKKNADMETPHMVLSKQHAGLVKEGEQWMKTTSEACSITAALIVTIVFAAAITVPGGNDQEKGIPLFKKEIAFYVFAVSDAISLFSAASALLVFLSILTTRFAEMDFLVSLPRRLIIGLCALFLSTASMMIAFCAVLFLVFCDQRLLMLLPIGVLACMPIFVIVTLQLPLLVDLLQSTYIPIFGKQNYIARGKFISGHPTAMYEL